MRVCNLKIIVFSIVAALFGQAAHAVLERTGPIDPANEFPRWYMDTTGLTFELCLPLSPAELAGGHCLLLPGTAPATPEVFPGQFFNEHFYWNASAALTPATGGKAFLSVALEGAFPGVVAPGKGITFTRIRARLIPAPVSGTYRFIHPYGQESIVATAGQRILFTNDVGVGAPGNFTGAMNGRVGPFLLASATPGGPELPPVAGPVPGKLYIADPARIGPVTGSPKNQNFFRIEGPPGSNLGGAGIDFIQTNNFRLVGRVYAGQIPSLVVPERATYARSSGSDQKIDVFATAFPTAKSRLPGSARPGGVTPVTSFFNAPCGMTLDAAGNLIAYTSPASNALESPMTAQNIARYGQSRTASNVPLPDSVCLKDNSAVNINGQSIPSYHPLSVDDTVKVTDTFFDPVNRTLTVMATSSDQTVGQTLTLVEFNAPLVGGMVNISGVTSPPTKIRILSSARGMGESSEIRTDINFANPLISQSPVPSAP